MMIYGKRNINNNTLHFCAVGVRDIRDGRGILGRKYKVLECILGFRKNSMGYKL